MTRSFLLRLHLLSRLERGAVSEFCVKLEQDQWPNSEIVG